DQYGAGIDISNVVIQSSEPPEPVASAFQKVDQARQKREEIRHEAQQRREKIINEAKGTAEQLVSEAQGDSAAMINRALGDARRFKKILREYQQAPKVTRRRMQLETMQKIISDSERVFILDKQVKGLLPLLDLQEGIQ
ncbi:MAG: FtsH protease activity modulator HflK, partial [bacterium]